MKVESAFVPPTFEGMMEAFGINLQRKTLYDQFEESYKQIEHMTKRKDVTQTEIIDQAKLAGDKMKSIIEISGVDPNSLRNSHNTLFLTLMDRLNYIKQQELEKEKSRSRAELRLSRKGSKLGEASREMSREALNLRVESEEDGDGDAVKAEVVQEKYKIANEGSLDLNRDSMDVVAL